MVEQGCLASLDGLIWLRTGHQVAAKFNQHQTTVSRNSRKCAKIFGISLERQAAEWQVIGDQKLLALQRKVHQHVRFQSNQPLRLDAQHWSGPLLCAPAPTGWILGNLNFLEYQRPEQLLRKRIIDAWLTSYPDTPDQDPDLATIRLSTMPMYLVVQAGHPLLALGDAVSFADVARYPLLPLPEQAFPKFQRMLKAMGLDPDPSTSEPLAADNVACQERIEDLMVGFSSPQTLPLFGEEIRILPLNLPIEVGDALVVRREFSEFPQIQALIDLLRNRLTELAKTTPDLCVLEAGQDEAVQDEGVQDEVVPVALGRLSQV
jgi:hypothetical protein